MIRDADDLLLPAVLETLRALDTEIVDRGAVKLAERYAAHIDSCLDSPKNYASAMHWIAPQLLDVLESLGATPAARSRLKTGDKKTPSVSKITAIRAARHG